jgi:nucleoside phosphorylase
MSKHPVIGLVMATMLEAAPIVRDLALAEQEPEAFAVYIDEKIALIISGIGKANAAMASAYLIHTRRPEVVCNFGASGAVDRRCNLGECYHITKVIEPDRPDPQDALFQKLTPDLLDGFAVATLATQDKPLREPAEREEIAKHAHLADMEGAAVVQACRRFETKCYLFKYVSDTPDHRQSDDIVENIELYRDANSQFFKNSVLPCLLFRK